MSNLTSTSLDIDLIGEVITVQIFPLRTDGSLNGEAMVKYTGTLEGYEQGNKWVNLTFRGRSEALSYHTKGAYAEYYTKQNPPRI